jgi:hypothetical protein
LRLGGTKSVEKIFFCVKKKSKVALFHGFLKSKFILIH